MSTIATSDVKQRSAARLADRLVLLELADEAGHDGWVLISIKAISRHTLLGARTIVRSLAALEAAGEVECRSGGGSGQSSCYRVLLSEQRPKGEPLPERVLKVGRACQIGRPPRNKKGMPTWQGGHANLAGGACQPGRGSIGEESAPGTAPGTAPVAGKPADEPAPRLPALPDWAAGELDPDGREPGYGSLWLPALTTPHRWKHTVTGQRRDLLFDAVLEAAGWDVSKLTRRARGWANDAVAELRAAGATPAEVQVRAQRYRANDPSGKRPTPSALAKHWAACTVESLERVDRRRLDRELAARQADGELRRALEAR